MFILVKKFQLKNKVFFFKETNSKAAKLFNNPTGLQKTERSCKGMVALRLWRWMDPHIFSQYLSRVYKRQRHNAWGIIQGSSNKKHGWGELNKYFDLQRIGVKFKLLVKDVRMFCYFWLTSSPLSTISIQPLGGTSLKLEKIKNKLNFW